MRNMVQIRGGHSNRYQAPEMRMGRSQFDLSHRHKTTFDAGNLIPYLVQEVLPGDTFTCKLHALIRIFSPLDAPVMDDIRSDIDFWYVPNRLTWENWTAFLGEHDAAGAQDTDYTVPVLSDGSTVTASTLLHYMGLPIGLSTTAEDVNCLPMRAYVQIYNEFYRDQNLIDEVTEAKGDSGGAGSLAILKSAKMPDYFTTALPYLQKGTEVSIPLGTKAYVTNPGGDNTNIQLVYEGDGEVYRMDTDGSAGGQVVFDTADGAGLLSGSMYADMTSVTGVSINALREAAATQRLLERFARGGTRHPEIIRSSFGVDVPDYRTQRPEYLGGGRGYVSISPVANTSPIDSADSPSGADVNQGQLAGVGVGELRASWGKSFVEHGWIIGILRCRAQVSYQQGLDRKWSRSTIYDFMWPELAHLGEQEILNKELWIEGDATDDDVFGYQERYAEYRFSKSLVTGKFASDASGSLDFWHLAEDFSAQPSLNQTFVEDASPMARITTVTSEPDFIIDGRFDLRVARALPVRPVPSLVPARF